MSSDDDLPGLLTSFLRPRDRTIGRGRLTPVLYAARLHGMPEPGAAHEGAAWPVRSWQLVEELDEPYRIDLVLVVPEAAIDIDGLVGGRIELSIARGDDGRTIHGVVMQAEILGPHAEGALVGLEVGPALALAGLSRHSRVFQEMTVPEIVEAVAGPVLGDYGSSVAQRLEVERAPRDYCVQYQESDLDFVLRILAEDGIAVLFDHSGDAERVVLVDAPGAFPWAGDEPLAEREGDHPPTLPWIADRPEEVPVESVQAARRARLLQPAQWKTSRWDWKSRPTARLAAVAPSRQPYALGEVVNADETRPHEGQDSDGPVLDDTIERARSLRERNNVRTVRLHASTNATALRAGSIFELTDPPTATIADEWLVTRIVHRGDAPDVTLSGGAGDVEAVYSNTIECLPAAVPYRPQVRTKPRIAGVQTAVVVDPSDELVRTDAHGRIRVEMLWDERRHDDGFSSCWLRLAQPWAGDGFGTVFLPRNGAEVVVTFVDGDPDRPLCLGCVYGGSDTPPYALPEQRTRTAIRTQSTDGVGFHELSFEDAKGMEEVFLHSQRNLREVIKAEHTTSVGAKQSLSVGHDREKAIGGSETTTIAEDLQIRIEGVRSTHVAGSEATFVGGGPAKGDGSLPGVTIGSSELRVEGKRYVWARDELVLQVGREGSATTKVVLTPTGITIVASESFAITIGGKAKVDIVPTMHQITAETVKAIAKGSGLQMHNDVQVEASEAIRLKQSDSCFARLDGDVTIGGADVSLGAEGMAELVGSEVAIEASAQQVAITGKAGVAVDSPANITVTAGGEATMKGTIVRGQ